MTSLQCCICFEEENASACVVCHFCNDGILCYECFTEYEESENNEYCLKCPVCRSILISHSIRNVIIHALIYNDGVFNKTSPLIQRWQIHFCESEYYRFINE